MSLKIALPKGILLESSLNLLEKAGFNVKGLSKKSRKLYFEGEKLSFILARPSDVATYVEYGAADIGITGKDGLLEEKREVIELKDLKFGFCKFILAVPKDKLKTFKESYRRLGQIKIATKYPNIAEDYFTEKGIQAELIKLRGSIELAPLVGLADAIVDLTTTGKTLRENNLVVIDEICSISARLIGNYVATKLKTEEIESFIKKIGF